MWLSAISVEQENISSEVVRNEVDVQKTDANATEPVKVTYGTQTQSKERQKVNK